jgi:hypothetical protein
MNTMLEVWFIGEESSFSSPFCLFSPSIFVSASLLSSLSLLLSPSGSLSSAFAVLFFSLSLTSLSQMEMPPDFFSILKFIQKSIDRLSGDLSTFAISNILYGSVRGFLFLLL